MENIKADVAAYILIVLLQRLETKHPGILQEMLEGIQSDQAALSGDKVAGEHAGRVFQEAIALMTRAKSGLQM